MVPASLYRRWCLLSCRAIVGHGRQSSASRFQSSCAPPLKSLPKSENTTIELDYVNEDLFNGSSGFWPASQDDIQPDPATPEIVTDELHSRDLVDPIDDKPKSESSEFLPFHLRPRIHSRKVDLSYVDADRGARTWNPLARQPSFFGSRPPTLFRATHGFRKMLAQYITQLEPFFSLLETPTSDEKDKVAADIELAHILPESSLDFLRQKSYEPIDLVSWAWIIQSRSVSQSIQRYVVLADQLRQQNKPGIPRFVALQLLRAPSIDALSFQALLASLSRSIDEHFLHVIEADGSSMIDIEPDVAPARAKEWDYSSAMILAVRLLRHGRLVCPEKFEEVIELACRMLFSLREQKTSGFDRLTFMCNRLLTLVSLPSSVMSHRSVREHQKAHLTLLRRMLAQKPQIPITREGYRALIKLQLIHEKTDDERAWARAKSDSWPPWQKSKLGIEDNLEYPGKESRAMKMLRRMTEAGYMHGLWEKAAAVLAGWDTDKSPTVQIRQILGMPPSAALDMSPVQSVTTLFGKDNATAPVMLAQLWAARVSATRSAREAWACFCEYRKSIDRGLKRLEPYHAMLERLLARQQETDLESDLVPGDSREVYEDPISQRDLVYLETDVPSPNEFYKLMLSDGVQPAGRLLSLLVTNAQSIDEGIQYLVNSSYSEVKKDILLHAHDYSASTIRDTLAGIPNHFLAAFLGLISSFETSPSEDCFQFRQGPGLNPGKQEKIVRPGVYGLLLLRASKTTYLPAYHAILNGVIDRSDKRTQNPSVYTLHKGADLACNILVLLEDLDIQPDLRMFHKFGLVVHNFSKAEIPSNWATLKKTIRRVKALFTVVVYGSRKLSWLPSTTDVRIIRVPDPEHIRMLVEILGLGHDIQSLLEVVDWMAQHTDRLKSNYLETTGGVKAMKRALFTLRVFLDGAWADEIDWQRGISAATEEQTAQVQEKLQSLGWPTAEEMADLVEENQVWLQWVRKAMWKSRGLEELGVVERRTEDRGADAEEEKG